MSDAWKHLLLLLPALALQSCLTIASSTLYQGGQIAGRDRVITLANLGIVQTGATADNRAGLTGMLLGNVGGQEASESVEAERPGSIVAGNVAITGTVDHSTGIGALWSGVNRMVRNLGTVKVIRSMVDGITAGQEINAHTDARQIAAGVKETEIKAGLEAAKLIKP